MKVTKKVKEFDAVQWRPGKTVEGVEIEYYETRDVHYRYGNKGRCDVLYSPNHDCIRAFLVTEDAKVRVYNGDWIITDAQGRKSVCPKAEFDKRYKCPLSTVSRSVVEIALDSMFAKNKDAWDFINDHR